MTGTFDSFQRPINYLRISVTDRCNLRCSYCMPMNGVTPLSHDEILTYEEICLVAKAAASLGITKIRLTGGEPLVRTHLTNLIRMLAKIDSIDDLSLTTNGSLLAPHARGLKDSGLRRVNVSLDSLRPERFREITRLGKLEDTLRGIQTAQDAGLGPVKINVVVMRGVNDDEIIDFASRSIAEDWNIRFIEFMPMGKGPAKERQRFVAITEIAKKIEDALGTLQSHNIDGNGPAKYFRLPGAKGTIGFISPVSDHFCFQCNRLRLTAEGKLRPCLLSDDEIDLREPIRRGAALSDIKRLLAQAIEAKPKGHKLAGGFTASNRTMSQIGG